VFGHSAESSGVVGESDIGHGVVGQAHGNAFGVFGKADVNSGVVGESTQGHGVVGQAHGNAFGVFGKADVNSGVMGESTQGHGVVGLAHSATGDGVFGESNMGVGVRGKGGRLAGFFEGNVEVTGNLDLTGPGSDIRLTNADCAEDFDVCGENNVDPGTVMILGDDGTLFESLQAYDKRVAGVVSGAGDYKPAIVLDGRKTSGNRQPIALMGKVFCKADAQFGTIQVGDLLTSSPTPGHAMVASEPDRAFGAILGKALRPLLSGSGLIPILVALQ